MISMECTDRFAFGCSRAEESGRIMEWLLIGLLAFMPFAFGVVEAWSEQIVFLLCAALWAVFAARLVTSGNSRIRWHWTYVPVGVFLLAAALQCIPLPTEVARVLSPGAVMMKQQLLADVPELQSRLRTTTLSFYQSATLHDLRLAFAIATVFFVVINEYRDPAQIRRLLAAISVIGGAVVLVCLAQDLLGNGKIYGFVPAGNGGARSGPFVHHGHYAQFMSLSMGAALGWLLILRQEDRQDGNVAAFAADYLRSHRGRRVAAILILLILGATTILLSLSRGGMISMLIAAAFTTTILGWCHRGESHGWILIAVALLAFACILYMGFDAVYDRLATLGDFHSAQSGRVQILKDILGAWTRFPVFGTGLGTHSVVYPMFDHSTIPALAGHAENEYAQAAEEMGALGFGALAALGILIWTCYARIVRRTREPIGFAAYGLGFGLLAILIHSLSDFGQHLPANAMLSVVFCALLVNLDSLNRPEKLRVPVAVITQAKTSRYCLTVMLLCSCGLWVWVLLQTNRSRMAETHWAKVSELEAHMIEADWQESDAVYADLIAHASRASSLAPRDIHYRYWLNTYRWRSISRTMEPNGVVSLPGRGMEFAGRIAEDLREATLLCPTFGPTWCLLGQLEYSMLGEDRGLDHLRRSIELSPNDPTVCLVAALTDIGCGRSQEGLARLRRTIQLDDRLYPEVARVCVRDLRSPDAAMELAEGRVHRLTQLADILMEADVGESHVQATQDRIVGLLASQCRDPEAPASCFAALGRLHEKRQDAASAVRCFREALARDYGQADHHLALAKLLGHLGETQEAMHEARVCLRLRPQYGPAERLIAELSRHMASSSNRTTEQDESDR